MRRRVNMASEPLGRFSPGADPVSVPLADRGTAHLAGRSCTRRRVPDRRPAASRPLTAPTTSAQRPRFGASPRRRWRLRREPVPPRRGQPARDGTRSASLQLEARVGILELGAEAAREAARCGSGPSAGGRRAPRPSGRSLRGCASHEASVAEQARAARLRLRLEGREPARGESLQQRRGRRPVRVRRDARRCASSPAPERGPPVDRAAWAASASSHEPAMASAAHGRAERAALAPRLAAARPASAPGASGSATIRQPTSSSVAESDLRPEPASDRARRRRGRTAAAAATVGDLPAGARRRVGRSRSVPHRRGAR